MAIFAKNVFLYGLSLLSLLGLALSLSACRTSGSLRTQNDKSGGPTGGEIKTLENPVIKAPVSDSLDRELAITRGRLVEVETIRAKERTEFTERIAKLEEQNKQLLEQLEKAPQKQSSFEKKDINKGDGFKLLWKQAIAQSKAKNYSSAESLFAEIIRQYPTNSGTSWAIIGRGFAHYSLKKYEDAALSFNEILEKHPKHKRRSLASFGLGASFAMMKQSTDAKLFFEEAASIAPRSAHGQLAKSILGKKSKVPRNLFGTFPEWYQ